MIERNFFIQTWTFGDIWGLSTDFIQNGINRLWILRTAKDLWLFQESNVKVDQWILTNAGTGLMFFTPIVSLFWSSFFSGSRYAS